MQTNSTDLLNIIIKNSPHLSWMRDNTIFITTHGSRAYGTNRPDSDWDYKGVCIPPKQYYLSNQHKFEQAILQNPDPDAVIYDLRKFMFLASQANPNVLEVLFTDPSDHILVSPVGQILLDNKEKFLSKRVKFTFQGYSYSQAKRMDLHRRYYLDPPKAPPTRKELGLPEQTLIPQDQLLATQAMIQKELDRLNFDFMENLDESNKIEIQNTMTEMLAEFKISKDDQWLSAAKKIGLDDNFIYLMQKEREYTGKKREWDHYQDWKKNRNAARAADEEKYGFDLKNAYQVYRLSVMSREMLETGKVLVKRPDREVLLEIRAGKWSYEQLMEAVDKENKKVDELYKTSNVLPNKPDLNAIDNLCMELIEKVAFK